MLHQHYENILSWLCEDVEHLSTSPTDEIFRLRTIQEAHMAYEVFNVLGFKAKIYDEDEYGRLYIAKPRFDKETLEAKLESARAYAVTLKQIQQAMQSMRSSQKEISGFDIKLMNAPDNSLKLTINAPREKALKAKKTDKDSPNPQEKATTSTPPPPRPISAHASSGGKALRRKKKKDKEFNKLGGTALAKTHLMEDDSGNEKGAISRWLYSHIFRHIMIYSAEISIAIIILMTLSGIMVSSKGFLCPDFATEEKNTPWYCKRTEIRIWLGIDDKEAELPDIPGLEKD